MLEVSFVKRARRQQNSPWMIGLREAQQHLALSPKEGRQAANVRRAKSVRENIRHDGSILERVSSSRRRLRTVRQYPPAAIRRARQIHAQEVQIGSLRNRD